MMVRRAARLLFDVCCDVMKLLFGVSGGCVITI